MVVKLDGIELQNLQMSMDNLQLEIAILLYDKGKLSLGQASRLVNMNRILFQEELGKRKIATNYDESEFEADLVTLGIK